MVVNTCASKLVSWFLMPWRMPSIHWQYLKVAGCRQWWFQSTHSTPTLLHSCSLSTHKSWQTEGWFLQSKKLNIVVNPLSQAHTPQRRQQQRNKFLCLYMFLKTKKRKDWNSCQLWLDIEQPVIKWIWLKASFPRQTVRGLGSGTRPFDLLSLAVTNWRGSMGCSGGASKHVRTSIAALNFLNENISKHLEGRICACLCI